MPAPIWKEIFHGAYKINKSGTIVRVIPAPGTRPDRKLKPYNPGGSHDYVCLHYNDERYQVPVCKLLEEAFK